jgi:hypothetical protein
MTEEAASRGWRLKSDDPILDQLWRFKPKQNKPDDYSFVCGDITLRIFDLQKPGGKGDFSGIVLVKKGSVFFKDRITFANARSRKDFLNQVSTKIHDNEQDIDNLLMEFDHALRIRELEGNGESVFESFTGEQSLIYPLEEDVWLVDRWVKLNGLTLFVGKSGIGKSIYSLNLALSAAGGVSFLGRFAVSEPMKVLYIDLEMGVYELRNRLNTLLRHYPKQAAQNIRLCSLGQLDLPNPNHLKRLDNTIKHYKPRFVIIDNHSRTLGDKDENNNSEMTFYILNPYRKLMSALNFGLFLPHHTPWEKGRPRGATALPNAAEAVILLEETSNEFITQFTFKKERSAGKSGPKVLRVRYDPMTYLLHPVGIDLNSLKLPAKRADIVRELQQKDGIPGPSAYRHINKMLKEELLKEKGGLLFRAADAED